MATALVSLGSNLGDRAAALGRALEVLAEKPGLRIAATSSFHETRPAGGPEGQPSFLNAAAVLETGLPPLELLSVLQNIENLLGRVRAERWGPRTIDLDHLLYDQLELETPELTLPHPRMSFRRFVLEPAAEVAAEMVHPVCGNTIAGLLRHTDQAPRYVAIAGINPAVRSVLRKSPRLIVAFQPGEYGSYAHHPAKLLQAVGRLDHDQWLVGDAWGEGNTRFIISETGDIEPHDATLSALVQPRLLVVLPAAGTSAEVRARIRGTYRGPVLWLKQANAALVYDEILAAIAAME